MRAFAKWLALLGPAGLSPIAPATVGSALTALVGFFLPAPAWPVFAALLVVGTLIAVWAAGQAEHELGHDAKPICVDEAVGQTISLILVPRTVPAFVAAFVLFRIFDVWKPLGARQAQELPGGWGVVFDDVVAGIVACAAFHALRFGLHRLGVTLL